MGRQTSSCCWADWCVPCRKLVPKIEELRRSYPESELRILRVQVADEAERMEHLKLKSKEGRAPRQESWMLDSRMVSLALQVLA
ncbi:MAG: thioredoxin family protein [Myxococcaceae bacterium]|nr:thioredoxin family protein [Myxococcaceae bacterium]